MNTSTQSKYEKVRKEAKTDQPQIEPNEVRITTMGKVKKYVDYAEALLKGRRTDGDTVTQFDTIVLKATGRAINHAVTTAEVVKRNVGGLHQVTQLETLEIEDLWKPKEEGLKEVRTTRRVASIVITLSTDPSKIDRNAPGYQEPLASDPLNVGRVPGRRFDRPTRARPGRRPRGPRRMPQGPGPAGRQVGGGGAGGAGGPGPGPRRPQGGMGGYQPPRGGFNQPRGRPQGVRQGGRRRGPGAGGGAAYGNDTYY